MEMLFTAPDAWSGGFYELALELGPRDAGRLAAALEALWSLEMLDGCYLDSSREPGEQRKVTFNASCLGVNKLYGMALLPEGVRSPCGTVHVREEDGPDWLVLFLPMGSLGEIYHTGGFPLDPDFDDTRWRKTIDDWFAGIARRVHAVVAFRLALIGFEVSGDHYADEIQASGVPRVRDVGFLVPRDGKLDYFPRVRSGT